jgi:hypothetical protein
MRSGSCVLIRPSWLPSWKIDFASSGTPMVRMRDRLAPPLLSSARSRFHDPAASACSMVSHCAAERSGKRRRITSSTVNWPTLSKLPSAVCTRTACRAAQVSARPTPAARRSGQAPSARRPARCRHRRGRKKSISLLSSSEISLRALTAPAERGLVDRQPFAALLQARRYYLELALVLLHPGDKAIEHLRAQLLDPLRQPHARQRRRFVEIDIHGAARLVAPHNRHVGGKTTAGAFQRLPTRFPAPAAVVVLSGSSGSAPRRSTVSNSASAPRFVSSHCVASNGRPVSSIAASCSSNSRTSSALCSSMRRFICAKMSS